MKNLEKIMGDGTYIDIANKLFKVRTLESVLQSICESENEYNFCKMLIHLAKLEMKKEIDKRIKSLYFFNHLDD